MKIKNILKNTNAESGDKMNQKIYVFAATVCVITSVMAREIVIGTQEDSAFVDSEVSTNVAFNAHRTDMKRMEVRMDFANSAENCVNIGFGRDANGNGDLEPEETEFVIGRRQRKYFMEDVVSGNRHVFAGAAQVKDCGFLKLSIVMDARFAPKSMALECDAGPLSVDVGAQPWMFKRSWNLMKITRRGTNAALEVSKVDCEYRAMLILLR